MELKVDGLSKSFGKKHALKDVSISMQTGTYGLLGENGAGKSTLMKILATIDFPTKGNVSFDGENINQLDEKYRDILGYMPQDYSIFPNYTANDFLEYMGTLKGIQPKLLKKKMAEVLEFVNLSEVANKRAENFSGGMKRRLGIAQAILNDPKILILDEPTAGLDPKERIRFSNIISEMSKDKIVILSTHIVSDIEAIANDLIIIKGGELVEVGTIDEMIERVRNKVFETTVDQENFNNLLRERKIIHRKQERENIRVRYVGEAYDGLENKPLEPSLEDYYVSECL